LPPLLPPSFPYTTLFRSWRRLAVAVHQFRPDLVDTLAVLRGGQLAIRFQSQSLARDVVVWDVRIHGEVDSYLGGSLLRAGTTPPGPVSGPRPRFARHAGIRGRTGRGESA